jgi:hypothetical protein
MDGICIQRDPQEIGEEFSRASKSFVNHLNSDPEFKEQAKLRLEQISKQEWISNIDQFYQRHALSILLSKDELDHFWNNQKDMSLSEFLSNTFNRSKDE